MIKRARWIAAGLALAALPGVTTARTPVAPVETATPDFARFAPAPDGRTTRLDYAFLDEQLRYIVLRMGESMREGAPKPQSETGTRFVYGHDSRYRLEGNRVVFEFLTDEFKQSLAAYRADLERLGGEIELTKLPRNEQLAFWINLHNAAVIDAIAQAYPVGSPDRMSLGGSKRPLDETPFITVAGVRMSPRDIRTRIVFPNWDDPRVIYGFFRGTIGGPSIQRTAYTGDNVGITLGGSAKEFVNSLRGVEASGNALAVSKIYAEAAPFYFPQMGEDLRQHLGKFADENVAALIAAKPTVQASIYPDDIADLANGEREPNYAYVEDSERSLGKGISPSMARMLAERATKYEELRRQGRVGQVLVLDPDKPEEGAGEVE